jgi:ABC-type glutathione transport system ATPase component
MDPELLPSDADHLVACHLSVTEKRRIWRGLQLEEAGGVVTALLEARDLVKHFPVTTGVLFNRTQGYVHAVDGVSLSVEPGETLGLVGETGCGKSTTARLLTRLLEPTSGEIRYDGTDITHWSQRKLRPLRRDVQMIFQDPYSSLNPRRPVGTIIGEPLRIHGIGTKARPPARVRELMRRVGLNPEHYNRYATSSPAGSGSGSGSRARSSRRRS